VTVHDTFTANDRRLVETAPFFWLATADDDGWPDVSYKGGRPGFARVLDDDRTLAFPSYDGNGMYRSMGNIAANSRVGLLFVDFEHSKRLRVKGTAKLHRDEAMLAGWPGAELVVTVAAVKVFFNCPRYVHRMTVEEISVFAPGDDHVPPAPDWKQRPEFKPYLPGASAER
jgi:predicted pyridoxine 5'-phosphate oxidase superfamily flavin-nucleotide-binding protein